MKEKISGLKPNKNADLILVNSPLRNYDAREKDEYQVLPALGLAYIAAVSAESGHNVGLLDAEHHGVGQTELQATVNSLQPRLVGINVLTPTRRQAIEFATNLDPETTLVVGGPHANAMIERTLTEFSQAHERTLLAKGEAEYSVRAILDGQPKEKVPGLVWIENNGIKASSNDNLQVELDSLPTLDRSFLPNDPSIDKHTGRREARVVTSRGCPFNCTFCAGARESLSMPVRYRDVNKVLEELKGLIIDFDCESIRFIDDLFIASEKRTRAILGAMEEASLPNIYWDSTGRANILSKFSPRFLDYLQDHGAYEIAIGIESGSKRLRQRINKRASEAQIQKSVKELTDRGIRVKGYFIIGIPTETTQETLATLEMAKDLTKRFPGHFRGSVFIFRPYPGTREWQRLIDSGYQEDDLLNMHAVGSGERSKHRVLTSQQFGECTPAQLNDLIGDYYQWQQDYLF